MMGLLYAFGLAVNIFLIALNIRIYMETELIINLWGIGIASAAVISIHKMLMLWLEKNG